MVIVNSDELCSLARGEELRKRRRDVLDAVESAIKSVMPENLLEAKLKLSGGKLYVAGDVFDLAGFDQIYVVGGGKACVGMVRQLNRMLGDLITGGEVAAPIERETWMGRVRINPASHPIPDEKSVGATQRILDLASKATSRTLYLVLISGGASAMLSCPREGITVEDKAEITRSLLKCGANIDEINTVRKHLSKIKGGQLQKLLYPATTVALIISDVVGDRLDVIASGPTVPDPTTFNDAYGVLRKYGLVESAPPRVLSLLEKGVSGLVEDTPKPGDPIFSLANNYIIGSNRDACMAAWASLQSKGYTPLILTTRMQGEAREVAKFLAGLGASRSHPPFDAFVLGGETTVTLRGRGVGGRNQELCLSALIALNGGGDVVLASVGTDGVDGFTEAAGAIIDTNTYSDAVSKRVSPEQYLDNNDSGTFFKRVGGAVITGPTGTNVSDIVVVVNGAMAH
jgi:glycerate 2-kinase